MYCTGELKADGLQLYQELIGSLRWAIEISRVDILLKNSILYKHLALPCEDHLELGFAYRWISEEAYEITIAL